MTTTPKTLATPVLQPDRRLFDELAHAEDGKRRQHPDPQHAAPADVGVAQAVKRGSRQHFDRAA
jgi:hypothetical protein